MFFLLFLRKTHHAMTSREPHEKVRWSFSEPPVFWPIFSKTITYLTLKLQQRIINIMNFNLNHIHAGGAVPL